MAEGKRILGSLLERTAIAMVSAVAAAVTLFLFATAFVVLGLLEIAAVSYALLFSGVGLTVVGLAAATGFCVGADRMANIFSFFWGTHSFWSKIGSYFNERVDQWSTEHFIPTRILIAVLVILLITLALVLWQQFS